MSLPLPPPDMPEAAAAWACAATLWAAATARAVGFDEGLVGHLVAAALKVNFGESVK